MSEISIELIPDLERLKKDVLYLKSNISQVTTINIPDLPRFITRSWEACGSITNLYSNCIPHIRAVDYSQDEKLPFIDTIKKLGLTAVLLVTGDTPTNFSKTQHQTSIFDLLERLREELPNIQVYGAIDPYRQSIQDEVKYIERKIEAGFDGFFTQPFFSLSLLRFYFGILKGINVYWGLSPVTTEATASYWRRKNKVHFSASFHPSLDWNINFGRKVVSFIQTHDSSCYIMPIKVPLEGYLEEIFIL